MGKIVQIHVTDQERWNDTVKSFADYEPFYILVPKSRPNFRKSS